MPSGHTALAFSLATAIMYAGNTFVASFGYTLAFLVAHTRVQSKIHSLPEVIIGGLLGFVITMILFKLIA
jgi:diacylglycerol kinase (ATP)